RRPGGAGRCEDRARLRALPSHHAGPTHHTRPTHHTGPCHEGGPSRRVSSAGTSVRQHETGAGKEAVRVVWTLIGPTSGTSLANSNYCWILCYPCPEGPHRRMACQPELVPR